MNNVEQLYQGRQIASQKSVMIMALARNIENHINSLKHFIDACQILFKDFCIIILENDSDDNTKKILRNWAVGKESCVELIEKQFGWKNLTDYTEIQRLEKLAYCRNIILDEVYNNYCHENYDLIGIYDCDIKYVSIDGILDSFYRMDGWDGVTSNGICYLEAEGIYEPIYYDNMSLVYDEELKNGFIRPPFLCYSLVPVECAFGGLAFYKKEFVDFKAVKFGHKIIDGEDCPQHPKQRPTSDHYMFCDHVRKNGGNIFVNPNQLTCAWSKP